MFQKGNIVLLDCDGPCFAFDKALLDIVRPNTKPAEIVELNDWDIFKLLDRHELGEAHKVMEDPDFWVNLPVKEAAQNMYEQLRKDGIDVRFCTSPWVACDKWEWARRQLLKKHFGVHPARDREQLVVTSAKDLVFGNFLIDDKPSTLAKWNDRWNKFGCEALMFETYSNLRNEFYPRLRDKGKEWELVTEPSLKDVFSFDVV